MTSKKEYDKISMALTGLDESMRVLLMIEHVASLMGQFEQTYRVGSEYIHFDHLLCGKTIKLMRNSAHNQGAIFTFFAAHLTYDTHLGFNLNLPKERWVISPRDDRPTEKMFVNGVHGWELMSGKRPGVFEND